MARLAERARPLDRWGRGIMTILVTGGAGYIGSHTVLRLLANGADVVVADSLANASPLVMGRLEELAGRPIPFAQVDVADVPDVVEVIRDHDVAEVIHFAGLKAVGESVEQPLRYYDHNLGCTLGLLRAMTETGVRRLVFSSSATVYGPNAPVPTPEHIPTSATNPYGWTKVMLEQILRDVGAADPTWRIALLRYFNPGGAHPSGHIGEDPRGIPNNLLPYVTQVAVGRRDKLRVFGNDYPTPDGTGVRDFIHVDDLAAGHVAALEHLRCSYEPVDVFNLGTGRGTSVLEIVHAFEQASGRSIPLDIVARRPGDIAVSYADPTRAHDVLGWRAERTIKDICADAWRWQQANPNGFQ